MKKRFIAGAVCPRCGLMDKVVMLMDSNDKHRECVSCGYSDKLDDDAPIAEPETRVNQPRLNQPALQHEDEIQLVKVVLDGDQSSQGK